MFKDAHAEDEVWRLTVVRAYHFERLKQEKSWRPIVQLSVHQEPVQEVMLGVDGQNPNLKMTHLIQGASHESRLDFELCSQAKTKKKSKRRMVLAKTSVTLGEILVRQGPNKLSELQLTCQVAVMRRTSSNGKSGLVRQPRLHVRLQPPPSIVLSRSSTFQSSEPLSRSSTFQTRLSETDEPLSSHSERALSETLSVASVPDVPAEPPWEDPAQTEESTLRRRRRKPKGYHLFSESECGSEDSLLSDGSLAHLIEVEDTTPFLDDFSSSHVQEILERESCGTKRGIRHWIAGSFLPQYSPDRVSVLSQHGSSLLDTISPYHRLNEADGFDEIQKVMTDLQNEWSYVGASLMALAAIDATVFGYTPDGIIEIDSLARQSTAAGALAAAFGLAIDVWLILQYNCTDPRKFQTRALGVFDNYIWFCMTCRVPALCLLVSTASLLFFMCAVAFDLWPTGSLVVCFLTGFLVTSQYILWAVVRGTRVIVKAVAGLWRGTARVEGNDVKGEDKADKA
ncbi:hypothetical protein OE88DRAFT_1640322 [Heliocybe sulcata]|uniref:Uncharacterized protein n=1 Tax=Heliocybe sulcata TaxID=5364 RepID=A0A5C3NG79_9AGAM|nr:hypothetical protein OE88DRAFT_1640322 [Heliocybe sulcata]